MTSKAAVLQAIRRKCLECSCGQPGEVRLCPVTACELWSFRFGKDPEPAMNRGFAKSSVFTGDSSPEEPGRYPHSPSTRPQGKPPVYTDEFRDGEPLPGDATAHHRSPAGVT